MKLAPLAPRVNLITGDNGLGKSFLLDLAWYVTTWRPLAKPLIPSAGEGNPKITYEWWGQHKAHSFFWDSLRRDWRPPKDHSAERCFTLYAHHDGGFSLFDPDQGDDGRSLTTQEVYRFSGEQVMAGQRVTREETATPEDPRSALRFRGLLRDWRDWLTKEEHTYRRLALEAALRTLSPPDMAITLGPPGRGEGWIPTLKMPTGDLVPLTVAPAGVMRALRLAYLLIWSVHHPRRLEPLSRRRPTNEVLLLLDEPETHLHPRWQRGLLPSLLAALNDAIKPQLTHGQEPAVQLLVATHSPLVLASMEEHFHEDKDALWHLELTAKSKVLLSRETWRRRGDVNAWLTSPVFGLGQPTSIPVEKGVQAAEIVERRGHATQAEIDTIERIFAASLSDVDSLWWRWERIKAQTRITRVSR